VPKQNRLFYGFGTKIIKLPKNILNFEEK